MSGTHRLLYTTMFAGNYRRVMGSSQYELTTIFILQRKPSMKFKINHCRRCSGGEKQGKRCTVADSNRCEANRERSSSRQLGAGKRG